MSKYANWWRPNVERALREYPAMRQRKNDLQSSALTPNYDPMPKSGEPSRTTENLSMRELPKQEETWLEAIERATDVTERSKDGTEVMKIIQMVYFRRTHSLDRVAQELHMDRRTVLRRRNRYIYLVAQFMGYI